MDLSTVPAEHLASLVSCVTNLITIRGVSGCDMVSIMDSVKCEVLSLQRQRLDNEETSALVRAMETRVEEVVLGGREQTLDVTALIQYSGQGRCQLIDMILIEKSYDEEKYEEDMKNWAKDKQWSITSRGNLSLLLKKRRFNDTYMFD